MPGFKKAAGILRGIRAGDSQQSRRTMHSTRMLLEDDTA
jgi:hypothetical protein